MCQTSFYLCLVLLFNYFHLLQNFSAPVVNACLSMLGSIKPEGGIILSRVGNSFNLAVHLYFTVAGSQMCYFLKSQLTSKQVSSPIEPNFAIAFSSYWLLTLRQFVSTPFSYFLYKALRI